MGSLYETGPAVPTAWPDRPNHRREASPQRIAPAHRRPHRVAGAANGNGGDIERHQRVAQRYAAGIRRHRAERGAVCFPARRSSIALVENGNEVKGRGDRRARSRPRRSMATQRFPFPLTRAYIHSVAILDRTMLDIPDVELASDEMAAGRQEFPGERLSGGHHHADRCAARRRSVRSASCRREPGRLSDKQIAVLNTFAAQAVIAIENARLLSELREVARSSRPRLPTCSRSFQARPGDLEPVFQAMLESATRICGAKFRHALDL